VVSTGGIEDAHGLLWVLMITSADNRSWPGDVPIKDSNQAGLPAPSVIRTAKIATIEGSDASKLGKISPAILRQVNTRLSHELGF
jgi:mRNA interferase MazF